VDIAEELEEIGLLLDQDALEAVLEEVTAAAVARVERRDVAAEQALREAREGDLPGPQEQMRRGGIAVGPLQVSGIIGFYGLGRAEFELSAAIFAPEMAR